MEENKDNSNSLVNPSPVLEEKKNSARSADNEKPPGTPKDLRNSLNKIGKKFSSANHIYYNREELVGVHDSKKNIQGNLEIQYEGVLYTTKNFLNKIKEEIETANRVLVERDRDGVAKKRDRISFASQDVFKIADEEDKIPKDIMMKFRVKLYNNEWM